MESGSVLTAIAAMRAAYAELSAQNLDALTHRELLEALGELEDMTRQLPTQTHRILSRLQREASPTQLGAKNLREVLTGRLRISGAEASRRLADAKALGPRIALSGQSQPPLLAKVAHAQAEGTIGAEHVKVLRTFFTRLPGWVDVTTREQAETTLVRIATGLGPEELRQAAERLRALLDPDGPMPDDAERARKRFVTLGPQQADGMSALNGLIDPELRATLEPCLTKLGARGMCNPADEEPRTKGTPSQEQKDHDDRTRGQRTHDALIALSRLALCSAKLGRLNGLPVTVIVSTTLQDLESASGVAVTGGGSLLPMRDLIRMSAHAHHYLAIYDKHTREELYLARTQRLASVGQRIMMFNRDVGCTRPGCTASAYESQVHHVIGWAHHYGQTNINTQTLACGPDNRLAEEGWTVRIRDGVVEWIPPPELDTGQPRINFFHHPERLFAEPDDPEPPG